MQEEWRTKTSTNQKKIFFSFYIMLFFLSFLLVILPFGFFKGFFFALFILLHWRRQTNLKPFSIFHPPREEHIVAWFWTQKKNRKIENKEKKILHNFSNYSFILYSKKHFILFPFSRFSCIICLGKGNWNRMVGH